MARAFYAGSFDPVTNGHLDILASALQIADSVVVAIGVHPGKPPLFSFEERVDMLREVVTLLGGDGPSRMEVLSFDGLAVDAARASGATLLLRGLRDGTDLDFEMQMAGMNATLAPELRTVLLPASPYVRHITATLVRQIARLGGDVSPFVPETVARKLTQRFAS